MPPKRHEISKHKSSNNVTDKIKEIKQRQQNWMRQREEHKAKEPLLSENDAMCLKKTGDNSFSVKQELYSGANVIQNDTKVPKVTSKGKSKGFNAWMKERENYPENDPEISKQSTLGASYVIADDYVNTNTAGSPLNSTYNSRNNLSPDKFDQLADKIVNRVRNELDISQNTSSKSDGNICWKNSSPQGEIYKDNSYYEEACSVMSDKSDTCSPDDRHSRPNSSLAGHYCPLCRQLMAGDRDPMLVIPCGHNICRNCSAIDDLDLCSVCSCEISSFTSNIMLKQIILDHIREKRKVNSSRESKSFMRTEERDYKEEIRDLMLRLEVLENESDSIKETMNGIKREILVEKRQVSNIEKQEDKVREEINELNQKLEALSSHKEDYFLKCERLEEKHAFQEDKLKIVKDTIHQLNRDVEKIQLIAKTE